MVDPMLVMEREECRGSKMCLSRLDAQWEGKHYFEMVAYSDPVRYVGLLWSVELMSFAPTLQSLAPNASVTSSNMTQNFAEVLVKRTIAFHKQTDVGSIDFANAYLDKEQIPRIELRLEKFTKAGGIETGHGVALVSASVTHFRGKKIRRSDTEAWDEIVISFKDWKSHR